MDTATVFRISGKVQGVGFRYFVSTMAQQLGLTGWVKNHSDGSVVGLAEGEHGLIVSFLKELKVGNRWSQVERVENQPQTYSGEYKSFEIRY
ncbi:MAG: acylphosphatase [FCB group bacterium]|nr:acylphosphatase [FCB group bacterium]MBL7027780.1 acylphosphatase [Candidatus Neomarinimicrobiota bacterium]MBL7120861.1 acylphosphatase [Candidatus Neomarinimicrobiota bacterium]